MPSLLLLPPGEVVVDLRGQNLGDDGAKKVARELKGNRTVKRLRLGGNGIWDAGAIALAVAMGNNSTLEVLGLGNNKVSDAGAIALAAMLEQNSTLKWLHLDSNELTDEGAAALLAALKFNCSLTWLNLGGDNFSQIKPARRSYAKASYAKVQAECKRNEDNPVAKALYLRLDVASPTLRARALAMLEELEAPTRRELDAANTVRDDARRELENAQEACHGLLGFLGSFSLRGAQGAMDIAAAAADRVAALHIKAQRAAQKQALTALNGDEAPVAAQSAAEQLHEAECITR